MDGEFPGVWLCGGVLAGRAVGFGVSGELG